VVRSRRSTVYQSRPEICILLDLWDKDVKVSSVVCVTAVEIALGAGQNFVGCSAS